MEKSEIRGLIKAQKQQLSKDDIENKSIKIIDLLKKSDIYRSNLNIYTYVSYNQEVDTRLLIKDALNDRKNVYVPLVTDKKNGEMEFFKIADMSDLHSGYMGIDEPDFIEANRAAFLRNGLFIMPGLAFDRNYHRIGYGGGFYDRFLLRDNCFDRVALCFDFQLLDEIPYEEHDLKPDKIITEMGIY